MYITLDAAKDQLLIQRSNPTHDDRITRLIASVENETAQWLNAPLTDFEESGVSPVALPEDMVTGMLFLLEAQFDKDPATMELLEKRGHDILWPYRTELGV